MRKHLGYSHIPSQHASAGNAFLRDYLTPYLNYHRLCFFPEIITNGQGRQRRRYRYEHMTTPYERLKADPDAEQNLTPGTSFHSLDQTAHAMTDNQSREKLFKRIHTKNAA